MNLTKDPLLLRIVKGLEPERRRWSVVDEWEDDLVAIGFTSATHPDRIFYLSIYNREPGTVQYSCDVRTRGLTDITTLSDGVVEYDELLPIMVRFLEGDALVA